MWDSTHLHVMTVAEERSDEGSALKIAFDRHDVILSEAPPR
jgi:hypothetical protein